MNKYHRRIAHAGESRFLTVTGASSKIEKKVGNEFASEELQISRNEQAFKDWVSCIIL